MYKKCEQHSLYLEVLLGPIPSSNTMPQACQEPSKPGRGPRTLGVYIRTHRTTWALLQQWQEGSDCASGTRLHRRQGRVRLGIAWKKSPTSQDRQRSASSPPVTTLQIHSAGIFSHRPHGRAHKVAQHLHQAFLYAQGKRNTKSWV